MNTASRRSLFLNVFFWLFVIRAQVTDGFDIQGDDTEKLIGWRGESYQVDRTQVVLNQLQPWIETVSWQPRAFIHHNFLTHEECDHLIALATQRLSRSQVVGPKGEEIDEIRTSYSASIGIHEDDVVKRIEERIAWWTHLPVENGEPIEVLRYYNGQKYGAHWDWFDKNELDERTGNRVATVLMYLTDAPEYGGETALPLGVPIDEGAQKLVGFSPCASVSGISIRPHKGDVLLFWDMYPDGEQPDRHALHASCPTLQGTKWTATKWIHGNLSGKFKVCILQQDSSC